jgi:hypothetical protein
MSASNWAICPQCLDKARKKADEDKQAVMAMYGQVPVEEFDAAREALTEPEPNDFRTFREDYEFYGAREGTVHATYEGGCTVCDLHVELVAEKQFWP